MPVSAAQWGIPAGIALALLVSSLSLGWLGHMGSDDGAYIGAAVAWLEEPSYVPHSHWAVRHTLVLPLAGTFHLLGVREWTSVLPNLLYGLALLTCTWVIARRFFGAAAAWASSVVLVTTPIFSEQSTVAGVDMPEAFFVLAALGSYLYARTTQGPVPLLFCAGALAGLAFETRETSIAFLAFLGIAFCAAPAFARLRYWIMAVGFLMILGAESTYYWTQGVSPLHRFDIALNAAAFPKPEEPTGNLTDHPLIAPLVCLLFNNEFGLIFWAGIVAWVWMTARARGRERTAGCDGPPLIDMHALSIIAGLAVVWVAVNGYVFGLRALPRYFLVPAVCAALAVGAWLAVLWESQLRRTAVAFGASLILSGLLLADLSNQQGLLAERTAVRSLETGAYDTLVTDPFTGWRASELLAWAEVDAGRLETRPPRRGDYFLFAPDGARRGYAGPTSFRPGDFMVQPEWKVERVFRGTPTMIGRGIRALGLEPLAESYGLRRLVWETLPVTIYHVE